MKQKFLWVVTLMIAAVVYAAPNAANGQTIYTTYCQGCHAPGAVGVQGVGPALKGDVANWKFEEFKAAVLTGVNNKGAALKPMMPRWGTTGFGGKKPTDAQLEDLQAYLKSLK